MLLVSCNHIESGETLSQEEVDYVKRLNLLDDGENIIAFYSEYNIKGAGNFFTDRRLAAYWIDDRYAEKNDTVFAYYEDIVQIDTVYIAALTYTSYLLVTRRNGTKFKVCVDGEKQDVKWFFERA